MSEASGCHAVISPRVMLRLSAVTRAYRTGGRELRALDGVDLTLMEGEFAVVLGPSGSGKTTLLNVIGGLDTPTSGTVELLGQDITSLSRGQLFAVRRESVSFIFQGFNLFPGLTARENVQFGIDAARRGKGPAAVDVLAGVGLAGHEDKFPAQLSGGEQQRVAIARAIATGNPVLLADEPTGELDFRTGVRILELLKAQAGPGRAVLLVTHNREIARTADRVVELSSGRIVSDGPPPGGRAAISELYW